MSGVYGAWARNQIPHTSPETYRTRCDMCSELSCKLDDRSKLHPWTYYCDALKRSLTIKEIHEMTKQACPKHVDMRKRARK